jgi:hypothetical protein
MKAEVNISTYKRFQSFKILVVSKYIIEEKDV